MKVVSDTGPLLYLCLIGHYEILPKLYKDVSISSAVVEELLHQNTPQLVRSWIEGKPEWLHVHQGDSGALRWPLLDKGERASLALAMNLDAHLLLADDASARNAAQSAGMRVTGTLGVLYQAAQEGHLAAESAALGFQYAVGRLRETNFFFSAKLDAAIVAFTHSLQ